MSQPPNVPTSSQPPPVAIAADSPPPPAASLPPPVDSIPPPVSIAPPPPPPSSPPPPASFPPPPSDATIILPPPNTTPPPPDTTPPPPPPDITPPPPPPTSTSPSPSPSPSSWPPLPLDSQSPQSSYYGKLIPSADHTINSLLKNEKVILAGVVTGAGLLLFIMILLLVCLTRRRKRRQRDDDMHYYRDNGGNGYYNNSSNWSNSNGSHNNHEMRMPPSTQVSSEYSWQLQPPPPPPPMMMSSNEINYSASSYSGQTPPHPAPLQSTISLGINQSSFSYQDLAAATGGFAQANLLGQGGFGYVHKGVLPNGKEVAVKSLKANSGQGETEFQAEVDIISRVHHRHLVSLVGYCISGSQRMLVYELVPNDTLENHLHGTAGYQVMDWPTRMKVALGAAKGFSYLHEDCHPRIIHRDIKASNILLDENFEAKVADFGLAKLSLDTNTHISTRIMGTFGYLAPEYAASGKLTDKSDVYSYGVVLLELITGKRPIDINSEEDSLVDWARPILKRVIDGESAYDELADPLLSGKYDPQEMLRMIACADACVRHSSRRRPRMSQVVRALEGDASFEELGEAMRHSPSMGFGSSSGSEFESKKYKKSGVSSQDFSSHEYGATGESVNSGRSSMA